MIGYWIQKDLLRTLATWHGVSLEVALTFRVGVVPPSLLFRCGISRWQSVWGVSYLWLELESAGVWGFSVASGEVALSGLFLAHASPLAQSRQDAVKSLL